MWGEDLEGRECAPHRATLEEAERYCFAQFKRLCFATELQSRHCCSVGCQRQQVWALSHPPGARPASKNGCLDQCDGQLGICEKACGPFGVCCDRSGGLYCSPFQGGINSKPQCAFTSLLPEILPLVSVGICPRGRAEAAQVVALSESSDVRVTCCTDTSLGTNAVQTSCVLLDDASSAAAAEGACASRDMRLCYVHEVAEKELCCGDDPGSVVRVWAYQDAHETAEEGHALIGGSLENGGVSCFDKCGGKQGPCPDFCGSGLCCVGGMGFDNGCRPSMGDGVTWRCVAGFEGLDLKYSLLSDTLLHEGLPCEADCPIAGLCAFCGQQGACCRQGEVSDAGCSGLLGSSSDQRSCVRIYFSNLASVPVMAGPGITHQATVSRSPILNQMEDCEMPCTLLPDRPFSKVKSLEDFLWFHPDASKAGGDVARYCPHFCGQQGVCCKRNAEKCGFAGGSGTWRCDYPSDFVYVPRDDQEFSTLLGKIDRSFDVVDLSPPPEATSVRFALQDESWEDKVFILPTREDLLNVGSECLGECGNVNGPCAFCGIRTLDRRIVNKTDGGYQVTDYDSGGYCCLDGQRSANCTSLFGGRRTPRCVVGRFVDVDAKNTTKGQSLTLWEVIWGVVWSRLDRTLVLISMSGCVLGIMVVCTYLFLKETTPRERPSESAEWEIQRFSEIQRQ